MGMAQPTAGRQVCRAEPWAQLDLSPLLGSWRPGVEAGGGTVLGPGSSPQLPAAPRGHGCCSPEVVLSYPWGLAHGPPCLLV